MLPLLADTVTPETHSVRLPGGRTSAYETTTSPNRFAPILAQSAGGLAEGASKAMGIVMLIGFIFGTICVVGGGFAIRRGDTDAGKLSIIGGLIIAGAPVIVKALFTAFGLDGSTVDVGTFE